MKFTSSTIYRFLFGILFPFVLEALLYQTYLFLNPNSEFDPDFMFFLIFSPLIIPLIFLYFLSPYFLYNYTQVGNNYKKLLRKNIDNIFLSEKEILEEQEEKIIREELLTTLIPDLERIFRRSYVDSYFQDRSATRNVRQSNLLSFFETVFLFGMISGILNIINGILALYVHFTPINTQFNIGIDQIENIGNALLFILVFILVAMSGFIMATIAKRRIAYLIPSVIPGFVQYRTPERVMAKKLTAQSIAGYDLEPLIGSEHIRNDTLTTKIMEQSGLIDQLVEIIDESAQDEAGKLLAWESYSKILKEKGISNNKIETISESFLESSVIKSAELFSFDYREFQSLKSDLTYVYEHISSWDSKSSEERLTAFMLLYRAGETLFRGILRKTRGKMGNFGSMVLALADMNLINNDEQIILNSARKSRNWILHRTGEEFSLSQGYMRQFYDCIKSIITRAGADIGINGQDED
ncbi:MAG: hypothetical protein ACW981_21140 [Candidatus Hodarchaeales archaeon]